MSLVTLAATNVVPATSLVGMAKATATSANLTTTGLGVTIPPTTRKIVVSASSAGTFWNYNGAASSSSSVPVPTTPLALDCNATDAALLNFYGQASTAATYTLYFQG